VEKQVEYLFELLQSNVLETLARKSPFPSDTTLGQAVSFAMAKMEGVPEWAWSYFGGEQAGPLRDG
jgi:hypothetical protein